MELRHLRYFVGVAEEENVTRAADRLHVSQPALSRQIRDLEDELGFALLERSAKSVRLTQAGRVFLDEAQAVLRRSEEAVAKARQAADGQAPEIHVGYAPSLTVRILPRALRILQKKLPAARIVLHDLSTEEMLVGLRAGDLDAALLVRPTRAMLRGLRFEELAAYPLCLAVPPGHPLSRRRTVALSQAAEEPLIAYCRKDYPEYHTELETLFATGGLKPRIVEEHDSASSLIAAVEAGRGAAIVPDCLACMTGPRLKLLPLKPAPPPIAVGAGWTGKPRPGVEEFLAAVRSAREKA